MWPTLKVSNPNVKVDYYLLLVLCIPILLFLFNQEWFFPYGNASDNWIDDAYFLDYGRHPSLLLSYKAVRLSWILKGWLAHKLFSPLIAYYVLNVSIFYVCIIAFYYIAKILFDGPLALLATAAFATYSQFHSINSFEWDYHTHDAAANILLTLLFLLLAVKRPHWKLYLFLAGTTWVSAFQSPFVAIHGLSVIFWYVYLNRQHAKHSFMVSLLMFGLGSLVMITLYGVINHAFGGSFFYFLPQIPGSHVGWPGLAAYAYQASYWESFGHMLLYNKGIIVPLFTGLVSLGGLFYVLKKHPDHPYKKAILLCFFTFYLCLPIPIIYQAYGWPVLSIEHWEIGMAQFVFLAIAGLFAAFFPTMSSMENEKPLRRIICLSVFAGFCGALIFGFDFQRGFNKFLILVGPIRVAQIGVFLLLIFLLWKNKKIKEYSPIIYILIISILFPSSIVSQKIPFMLFFPLMLYFLWNLRHSKPRYLNKILLLGGVLIFPLLSFWRIYVPLPAMPIIAILMVCAFAFLPLIYISFYWKQIRKYSAVLYFSLLLATSNIYTSSIPIAFYAHDFKCGYFKDQYVAIVKGVKILRSLDPTFHMYLWFRNNEVVPYPNESCRKQNLAGVYGFPVMGMTALYAAIFGARYRLTFPPDPKQYGLLYHTLNNLPDAQYWKQVAPKIVLADPDRPLFQFLSDTFGGYLGSDSFSDFKDEKFWLHVFPDQFKLAILGHELQDNEQAVQSLNRYGYRMVNKTIHYVKEGIVSYYIVAGVAEKLPDPQMQS
ncbi:MAG: hypothetical protein A3F41_05310 [Coxiella sp. RIFCSPHIGHO2_12_FULL_44_14]|nr:MAG: hypothetical protein A3F41_05310 [Coxiella sp. RIFCSPHIGHO2_12_FULL_44_14]